MEMKHYIDIENLRAEEIQVSETVTRRRNDLAFELGDHIHVTEKRDGANFSICWDKENGKVACFSHRQELTPFNTLQGAFNFAEALDTKAFESNPEFVVFGEWNLKNKIAYGDTPKSTWFVFDIFDKETGEWLDPATVEAFCKEWGLTYIAKLYEGPFNGWDDLAQYLHKNSYGDRQEGIVVRNVSKMHDKSIRTPWILKIVNKEFKESMVKAPKTVDPEKEAEKARVAELMNSILTRRRVEKMLDNLRDEGVIGTEIAPEDMKIVAKHLPKRMYEDCMKEEREVMEAVGEYAGKLCGSISMAHAKAIILGE